MSRPGERWGDISLGFPIKDLGASGGVATKLARSFDRLYGDASLQGAPCRIDFYGDEQLYDRLAVDPYVPNDARVGFELFEDSNRRCQYIIWRCSHVDVDAFSPIALAAELVGRTGRLTVRKLLELGGTLADNSKMVGTYGSSTVVKRVPSRGSVEIGRWAAAIALRQYLQNGLAESVIEVVGSARGLDDELAGPGALLTVPIRLSVDPGILFSNADAERDRLVSEAARKWKLGRQLASGQSERVNDARPSAVLNVQTVDWYSLLDALAADSRSSFKYPLFYWQNELVDSLNVDVELWHTDDIVLRSRSDDERAARDSYILGDLRDIDSDLSAQTNSALRGRRAELEHLHVEAKNYRESLGEIFNPDSDHTDGRNEFIAFSRGYEEMEIFCNDLAVSDSSDGVIVVPYGASERAKSFGACISLMEKRIPFRFVSGGRPASRFYIEDHISSGAGWNPSTESPIVAAAVLQSSGSSGEPKTTVVSDYELSNLIHNARRWLRLDIGYSKVLLAAAPEFDASYFEICLAVASGSLPVTITDNSSVVSAIIEACTRGAVTHLVATPSVIALLAASDFEFPAVVLSVGEYLSDEVLGLCSQGGNTEVIDLYGPSEAGIWTTLRYAGDGHVEHQPIDNAYVRVVAEEESHDDFERGTYGVTSDGTGRLRIGFLDRQVAAVRGEIDSGDRARISGGSVFLLGRDDGVVKLSGRRVSLTQVGRTLAPELGFRDWKVDTCLSGKRQFLVMVGRSVERDVPSSRWTSFSGLSVRVIFIDEWPLSLTGKLDFRGGWEAQVNQDDEVSLSAGSFSEDYCPAEPLSSRDYEDSELRTRVCNVVHKVLERPMNLDDLFSSVGASSLEMLDIHVQLGRELVDAPVPSSMQSLGTFAAMCTVRAKD